jgi:DNA polymerase III subunit delta
MVAVRPQDADRFLSRPDPAIRVVLIYGSDDGLVSERAAAFARSVLTGSDEAFGLVKLDSSEIAADPGRLADEAHTIPLFGGMRAIRVRIAGNRPIQAAVEAVLTTPPKDSWIVLEAGDIRKGTGLRKLCEGAAGAAAIACYADEGAALDRLIDGELSAFRLDPEARALLRSLLGSDRLASRSELSKLALFARGQSGIGMEDIRAVIGDGGRFAADDAVDAATAGDTTSLDRNFRRILASGTPAFVVAAAALRHFQLLHRIRAAIEAGEPAQSAIDRASGGIFYQRKAKLEQASRLWTAERAFAALERIDGAILESRLKAAIGDQIIGQALLSVATMARQMRRAA